MFRILDHPADMGIEAHGASLGEAFANAAKALTSIILDPDGIEARETREVVLKAADREHLLVKWLSEVLYFYDGLGFVGKEFDVALDGTTSLNASIVGEHFDGQKHRTRLDVKAITYHQLLVTSDKSGANVRVFLDI